MRMKVFRINDKPVYKLYKCMNFDIFLSKKSFFSFKLKCMRNSGKKVSCDIPLLVIQ